MSSSDTHEHPSPAPRVRFFHREDRDQLTALVNAHAAAVVPGAGVSVNTVLSALERCPEEYVTDPWVAERVTLVAEERRRIVAAAHLLRYRDEPDVGDDYRDTGHVEWFVHVPSAGDGAAALLMPAALAQLDRWRVRARHADGHLPVPGVYGVPDAWPHVRAVFEAAGFVHTGGVEVLLLARSGGLPEPGPAPLPGLSARRSLGPLGTRITAVVDGAPVAYIELDTHLDRPERHARPGGTADIADLVLPDEPVPGLAGWLLGEARSWLELSGVDRLLSYADPDDADDTEETALLTGLGFTELGRTARGWTHRAA
ncbi:N-acetyltransferase [Streptomyces sp. NPDC006798]|uniref:N-acetyltransferase n=1 Tax=Streptomyces sp. NPDC006798 TaxID=3155462 RepID=UPI0033DECDA9